MLGEQESPAAKLLTGQPIGIAAIVKQNLRRDRFGRKGFAAPDHSQLGRFSNRALIVDAQLVVALNQFDDDRRGFRQVALCDTHNLGAVDVQSHGAAAAK